MDAAHRSRLARNADRLARVADRARRCGSAATPHESLSDVSLGELNGGNALELTLTLTDRHVGHADHSLRGRAGDVVIWVWAVVIARFA